MKAAFRIFVLVIAAGYYSAPADAAGSAPAVLFVHAWVPELGPLENASTYIDAKLLKMAELARYGDFTAATDLANAMLAAHPEPRVRYLVLMFRHQLTRRLVRLPGGSAIPLSEDLTLIRMMHSAQDHADVSEAKQLASSLGKQDMDQLAAIRQVETIMDRCLENPLFLRYGAVPPNMAAAIDQNTREWDVTCKQNVSDFTEPGASPQQFAADHELMALLVDSRMAIQARDDLTTAKLDLQQGLQLVHRKNSPASESLWLLREGDLEASPRGSVLILGYELTAEKNVRSDLNLGHLEGGKTYDRRHGSAVEAAKYYDEAERRGIANFALRPSDIAIRRALLKFLQGEPAGAAYRRAANLAKAEDSPWNETMARTCAGVLSGTRSEFDKGVEAAEKASLPGGEFSMAQVVMSWNQRAVRDGDSASTVEELGAMADALPMNGFQISRAAMMVMRSDLKNNLGRSYASIDSQYIAINAEKAFLRTVADNKPKATHDAGFGEIVFETSVSAIILEQLVQLKFYLQMREVSEGMIVYAERRSAIEKEVEDVKALMAKE
jgi:hypothetical protein